MSNSPLEDLPDYAGDETLGKLSTEQTAQVGEQSIKIIEHEKNILLIEERLAKEEAALNLIQGVTLPELLDSMGIMNLTLKDGSTVEVQRFYSPHISEERQAAAHQWMDDNGFGSLIKKVALVAIDRGDEHALNDLKTWLQKNKYDFAINEAVNANTLKSFVKGQLESTEEGAPKPPLDLFGIFVARKAMIKGIFKLKSRKYQKKTSKAK